MAFSARVYEQADIAELPRSPTHLAGSVSIASPVPYHIIVHNLSSEGLLVESYYELEIGAEIVFDIEGLGPRAATVTWHDGSFYDCTFVKPVPAALVRAKLTNKVVWGSFGTDARTATPRIAVVRPDVSDPAAALVPQHDGLSYAARLGMITGGALLCWLPIAALVALVSAIY